MRTYFTALLLGAASAKLLALPIGNPSDPILLYSGLICDATEKVWFGFNVGFYGDYVFNRYLKDNESDFHKHVDHTHLYTNAAYLGFTFCNRLQAFATLGGTDVKLFSNFAAFAPGAGFSDFSGQRLEIQTQTDFSWSVGVRGILWKCGCWTLGAEGQYFRTSPQISFVLLEDSVSNYPDDLLLKYHEWQVGLGLAYQLNRYVSPYLALKGAWASVDMSDTVITFAGRPLDESITLLDLKNSRYIGYAVGLTFIFCEGISCTVEGRFVDEKALYVNGQLHF